MMDKQWEHLERVQEIKLQDMPYPSSTTLRHMQLLPSDKKRKLFKQMCMRWHPDKLTQRHGNRMNPVEKKAITNRSKEAFQALSNALTA